LESSEVDIVTGRVFLGVSRAAS